MNPDEVYSSLLHRTTAQIHRLALDPVRGGVGMNLYSSSSGRSAELLLPPLGSGGLRQRLAPKNWEEPGSYGQQQRLTGSSEAPPVKRMGSWEY
ncbi:hypothetical protein V5799_018694, partial [Amblyomma americanum]